MPVTIRQMEELEKGVEKMADGKESLEKSRKNMEFPSNSHKARVSGEEPEKVTQARVIKKSPGRKISEAFLSDNLSRAFEYVWNNVLVPAGKATISDLIGMGNDLISINVNRALFGDDVQTARKRIGTTYGSNINYGKYHNKQLPTIRSIREQASPLNRQTVIDIPISRRVRQSFEDIILESRKDAEEVLTDLLEIVDVYGAASLADFYGLVGVEMEHTDYKHGWDNLKNTSIYRIRGGGWILDLPRPVPL